MNQKKKRALVVEGGGMRSAYVAGALIALHEIGPRDFDVMIGTSAGACSIANFIAGAPEYSQYVLEEKLSSTRFIRLRKIPTRENIVDVDYLLDDCFATLDKVKKVLEEKSIKFLITSTDCHTGEAIFFDARKHNIRESLRASCAMPYFYRRKLFHNGHRLMDGGLSSSIPIKKAIEEGCTEIIVVCSRPKGYRKIKPKIGWINHIFFPRYPKLAQVLWNRYKPYNREMELVENPPSGIQVIAIQPQHTLPVSRITRNRNKIRQGVEQGFFDAYQILNRRNFFDASKGLNELRAS